MERMFDAKVSPFAQQVDRLLGEVEYLRAKQEDSDFEDTEEQEQEEQGQNLAGLSAVVAGAEAAGLEGVVARPVRSCRTRGGGRDAPYQKT